VVILRFTFEQTSSLAALSLAIVFYIEKMSLYAEKALCFLLWEKAARCLSATRYDQEIWFYMESSDQTTFRQDRQDHERSWSLFQQSLN